MNIHEIIWLVSGIVIFISSCATCYWQGKSKGITEGADIANKEWQKVIMK